MQHVRGALAVSPSLATLCRRPLLTQRLHLRAVATPMATQPRTVATVTSAALVYVPPAGTALTCGWEVKEQRAPRTRRSLLARSLSTPPAPQLGTDPCASPTDPPAPTQATSAHVSRSAPVSPAVPLTPPIADSNQLRKRQTHKDAHRHAAATDPQPAEHSESLATEGPPPFPSTVEEVGRWISTLSGLPTGVATVYSLVFVQNGVDRAQLLAMDHERLRVHLGVGSQPHRDAILAAARDLRASRTVEKARPNQPARGEAKRDEPMATKGSQAPPRTAAATHAAHPRNDKPTSAHAQPAATEGAAPVVRSLLDAPSERPRRMRPNHFLSFRISDASIHAAVVALQRHVLSRCPDLAPTAIAPVKLHISAFVLALDTRDDVERASSLLRESARFLLQHYPSGRPIIAFPHLGCFGKDVLFLEPAEDDETRRLKALVADVAAHFRAGGFDLSLMGNKDAFVPHATVMKTSAAGFGKHNKRNDKRRKGAHGVPQPPPSQGKDSASEHEEAQGVEAAGGAGDVAGPAGAVAKDGGDAGDGGKGAWQTQGKRARERVRLRILPEHYADHGIVHFGSERFDAIELLSMQAKGPDGYYKVIERVEFGAP